MKLSIASLRRRRRRQEQAERPRLNHPGYKCCKCIGRRLVGQAIGPHRTSAHIWGKITHRIDQCAACHLLRRQASAQAEERSW